MGPAGVVIGVVAGIFGILSEVLMPKGFNETDVFNELQVLDSQMDAVSAQIGDINSSLNALGAEVDYQTQVMELKDYIGRANAYCPWASSWATPR